MISRSDALLQHLMLDLDFPSKEATVFQTTRGFAKSYLVGEVLRKFGATKSDLADTRALEKFQAVNTRCGLWEDSWATAEDELMGLVKDEVYRFWNPEGMPLVSSFSEICELGTVGPGASIGALGGDFYTKLFSSPLTYTGKYLYDAYRCHFGSYPLWCDAEMHRLHQFGGRDRVVSGSRLSFVPKNETISRTICTEPSLNMFYQLGFGNHLVYRLRQYFGIDLASQPSVNREMARLGSFCGGFATLDLSSASDSLSLRMLKWLLPRDFMSWLVTLRSPVTVLPDGSALELNMVSSMGNGFTFPLQTMLFSSVVCACLRYRGRRPQRARRRDLMNQETAWSVFGDDIICDPMVMRDVRRVLARLGFEENAQKTFVEGPFRESCGEDYLNGVNVRPVYIKSLDTEQDIYVAINLLNEWCARVGVILPETIHYLTGLARRVYVPVHENNDAGIRVPLSIALGATKVKFVHGSVCYRPWRAIPKKLRVLEGEFLYPSRWEKRRDYNPSGLMVALLHGSIRDGTIGVRHDTVKYRLGKAVTPNWDAAQPTSALNAPSHWRRWESAVWFNLFR